MTDLIELLPANIRYTYSFAGSAQALDHLVVNARMMPRYSRVAVAHVNADFPESLRGTSGPERLSDHDHPVAYFNLPLEVTSKSAITASGLAFSRVTQLSTGTVTVTNNSGATMAGPIHVVMDNLTAGVTASGPDGTTDGKPYVSSPGGLAAGQSVTLTLKFTNPSRGAITFAPRVYSGNL